MSMDKFAFLAAQAAIATTARQDNIANNLANVSTNGFRAQLMAFRSASLQGEGAGYRHYAVESTVGVDTSTGLLQQTGRDMDVAIQGQGWFSVTGPDGNEAYTRNGSFQVDAQGNLVNQTGLQMVGSNGPINVPADHRLSFENDGTITAIPLDGQTNVVPLGKLKLVDIPANQVLRRDDGLFVTRTGDPPEVSNDVRVVEGYIETSNVNPIDMMVQMISAARQYDVNMKLISKADENARSTNSLLTMS